MYWNNSQLGWLTQSDVNDGIGLGIQRTNGSTVLVSISFLEKEEVPHEPHNPIYPTHKLVIYTEIKEWQVPRDCYVLGLPKNDGIGANGKWRAMRLRTC